MAYKDNEGNRERNNRISFYVTDDELKLIHQKMEMSKTKNRSEFIRENLLNNFILVNDYDYLRSLINEINKIGTNINQVTKMANTNQHISKKDLLELENKLLKIWDLIDKKM